MAVDTPDLATKSANRLFKMRMLDDEYNIDFGGRLPRGAVVLADEATALRWFEHSIAEIAPPDATTYAEEKRRVKKDEFLRLAMPAEGVFDQLVSSESWQSERQPERQLLREMPRRGRPPKVETQPSAHTARRPAGDPLAGVPVLTDPDPDED